MEEAEATPHGTSGDLPYRWSYGDVPDDQLGWLRQNMLRELRDICAGRLA